MQGQLTVTSNGVLFGTTSAFDRGEAGLFAINTTDGTILSATGLGNNLVHNGPSIVNDVLYQGTGEAQFVTQMLIPQCCIPTELIPEA